MITKEERAELRELVASVTLPLPWKSDSDGVIVSDLYDFVADCDGTGGDFIDPKPAKLIAGAVNAAPKLLDALDAADERIAGLEKDNGIYQDANIRLTKETMRALAKNTQPFRPASAAQWRPIEEAPKDGREVLVTYRNRGQVQFADYSGHKWWKRGPGREPLIPQPTHFLPIPTLPEGGV